MRFDINALTVCLSGPPLSGKTSIMRRLPPLLEEHGLSYVLIPETANAMYEAGWSFGDAYAFQRELLRTELEYLSELQDSANADTVYIFDRGMPDAMAYLSETEANKLLAELEMTRDDLFAPYKACFYLKPYYETANKSLNGPQQRLESTVAEVERLDKVTYECWAPFPNLRVVQACDKIETKAMTIVDGILLLINK